MPAYVSKDTGNGREGYLESQAQEYAASEAAKRAAHEVSAPTFTVWGVKCPILYGSSSICIGANADGFEAFSSIDAAKVSRFEEYACFQTRGWSQSSVEDDIFKWAAEIAQLGGCWE